MPTPFQLRVWRQCQKIPKGRVSTYKRIAKALRTKAYRAVGNALNKSPGLPNVPCHRVVNNDGSLGYFNHGKSAKKRLLEKEAVRVKEGKVQDFKKKLA